MSSILDRLDPNARKVGQQRDIISKILAKHTTPTNQDVADTGTQRFEGIINPNKYKDPGSVQDVANANTNAELAPQMANLEILSKAADAGHADSKNLLTTFATFAPDADQLAQMVDAAAKDPEEITPANAATWAARKATELGFGQVAAQARALKNDATKALITQRNREKTGVQAIPITATDLPMIQSDGALLPPPSGNGQPDTGLFQQGVAQPVADVSASAPSKGNTRIVTKYQGNAAPSGQMWVKQADGAVGLAPIPTHGNKSSTPKPITAAQAGQLAMVKQGQAAIPEIKRLMYMPGSFDGSGNLTKKAALDKVTLAQMANVPLVGAIQLSPKARELYTAVYNMANAKIRLESGQAVPESEVRRTANAYVAGLLDTPETALYKLQAPDQYFKDYLSLVGSTPSGAANSMSAPEEQQEFTQDDQDRLDELEAKFGGQ